MRRKLLNFQFSPWKVFVRTALICGMLGIILFGLSLRNTEHLPLNAEPLKFDGQSAYSYMRRLSKGFPNRIAYSESRRQAALWLKEELRKLGYEPHGLNFSETIAGKHYTGLEDIYAEKKGTRRPDEIIAVAAHYDVVDTTVEGAMDDGSGVGIVLELARIFAQQNPDRTLLFLITDSEEYGAFWGAHAFVQGYDKLSQIVAVANFDFVAPEKQTQIFTLCDGLKGGYTPLWLRELALDSVRSVGGAKAVDFTNIVEFIERAMQIPAADHGVFLAADVPAFDWVGSTNNFPYEMAHYHHTPNDVTEAIQPESMATYGRAAERLVRSIDALAHIPADFRNSSYWKVTRRYYIDGWVVTLLHILAFIPFLAYGLSKFGATLRKGPRRRVWAVLLNEAKNAGILAGSLLLGYVVILLLPAFRIITQYEIFPATQKSLLLYTPSFIAIFLVVAAVISVYWIFRTTFAEPVDSVDYREIRHAFHAALLALIILLALIKNSYLGTLLLLPPAYFWTAIRARRGATDRVLNMLLLVGGSITFVITAIVLGTIFHVGVVYWYLFLSAAYGLISAYTVVLFFMSITVMIRIFRSFVI